MLQYLSGASNTSKTVQGIKLIGGLQQVATFSKLKAARSTEVRAFSVTPTHRVNFRFFWHSITSSKSTGTGMGTGTDQLISPSGPRLLKLSRRTKQMFKLG
jgi:hypothetical protein